MTDRMFDQFVRDKLSDHKSSVPAGLWEKIAEKKDKDRKPFALPKLFWMSLIWILAGLGGGYIVYNNVSGDDKQQSSSVTPAGEIENATGNSTNNTNNTTATNQLQTGDKDLPSSNYNEKDGIAENDDNNSNTSTDKLNISGRDSNTGVNKDNQPGIAKIITPAGGLKDDQTKNNNVYLKRSSSNKKNSLTVIDDPLLKQVTVIDEASSANAEADYRSSFVAGKLFSLKNISGFESKQGSLSNIRLTSVDCPPTRWTRNDLYLEVYASPDYSVKTVNGKDLASNFLTIKDSTESQQLGYTAGFRLSKSLSSNVMLKAGLQYSQINEKFQQRTESERRLTTVITIRTVIRAPGDTLYLTDTSVVEQIGYRVKKTFNRYRNIEVPITLGYEFGNEKLKYGVNAGVILNLLSWNSGESLDTSFQPVSLNAKSGGFKKQSIGLGVYAGFSVIKPINEKTDVFVEPYVRYNISNMQNNSGYTQKFTTAGLNFGIRYKLKGKGQRK